MENPFKYINQPLKEVPQELKAKVINDIAMAKLIMEIAELFSSNLGHVIDIVTKNRNK